jgi:hypothetical protein
VTRGFDFYRRVFPVIEAGTTRIFGSDIGSYRDLHGWQAVLRTGRDGAVALFHSFQGTWPAPVEIPLPIGCSIEEVYGAEDAEVSLEAGALRVVFHEDYEAVAVRLALNAVER